MQQPSDDHVVADSSTGLIAETISQRTPSMAARIGFVIFGVAMTGWAAYTSFIAVLLLPVFLSPTIYFFYYNLRKPHDRRINPERLSWSYLGTAVPGLPLITLLQGALLIPFVSLIFGSQKDFFWHEFETVHKDSDIRDDAHRAARAAFTTTPAYWVFVVFFSYFATGATEETLKYTVIMLARRKQEHIRWVDYFMYGAASGLSFGTLEGLGFLIPECGKESAGKLLLTLFERMVMGIISHSIWGMLTGVNLARAQLKGEKLNFLHIVGPSIFFHGSMNFLFMGYCAWAGIIGWIHPEDFASLSSLLLGVAVIFALSSFTLSRSVDKVSMGVTL